MLTLIDIYSFYLHTSALDNIIFVRPNNEVPGMRLKPTDKAVSDNIKRFSGPIILGHPPLVRRKDRLADGYLIGLTILR
jgi:hypothetical protein